MTIPTVITSADELAEYPDTAGLVPAAAALLDAERESLDVQRFGATYALVVHQADDSAWTVVAYRTTDGFVVDFFGNGTDLSDYDPARTLYRATPEQVADAINGVDPTIASVAAKAGLTPERLRVAAEIDGFNLAGRRDDAPLSPADASIIRVIASAAR